MLASRRFFWKNAESVPKLFTPVRHCNAAKQIEVGVAIPKRIERGPTDILKALSSTVQRDLTAFPYKYPDDPYFYPYSNSEKRVYALSMESGRKSAKWIIKNNPGFFKNQLSDPPIEAFLPKAADEENPLTTEEALVEAIERRDVAHAMAVHELLQKEGTGISSEVKQSLLELVCFYNSEEKANGEELEFKWFANAEQGEVVVNLWKEQHFAESLFKSMDPNCPLANSAMIQGMIKYNNVQKAIEIFNRAKSNNVRFSLNVYNALLSQASNTSTEIPDGLTFIESLLKEMADRKIKPDLATLNAVLHSLMHMPRLHQRDRYVSRLLMEFVHLSVIPSLGTYHYLFRIFGSTRMHIKKHRELFLRLLGIIQSTSHEVRHPSDFLFFPHVMHLFSVVCKDLELVTRLNDILFQDDNIKFLENSFSESMYFRNYFSTVFKNEPIDIAMEKYRELVPTVYSPELDVVLIMLSTVIANGASEYLAELWEDLKRFRMSKYMKVLHRVLPLAKVSTSEDTVKVVSEAARTCLGFFEENGFAGANQDTVSHLLIAFLKTGDQEKALEVFSKVKDLRGGSALLDAEAIMELFQYAVDNKKTSIIMDCLRYADEEFLTEASKMAEAALPLLSESDQLWATQLVTRARERKEEDKSPIEDK